jgi:hypothetical protein
MNKQTLTCILNQVHARVVSCVPFLLCRIEEESLTRIIVVEIVVYLLPTVYDSVHSMSIRCQVPSGSSVGRVDLVPNEVIHYLPIAMAVEFRSYIQLWPCMAHPRMLA